MPYLLLNNPVHTRPRSARDAGVDSMLLALLLAFTVDWAAAHGTILGINGDISGASGSRSWQTHKGLHRPLQEWDQYSLLGVGGRIDEYDSAGGEPGQTQHGEQYAGVAKDPNGKPWDIDVTCKVCSQLLATVSFITGRRRSQVPSGHHSESRRHKRVPLRLH